ncbi:TetR/AcrR family transcriptional regulator [Parenemella sanctibonifatiensis]|uniref:TetR family transcriptional regulator n=1 Tax=Parenemella sanctibonifatiensis TaxID=2016505 RepID=A0A255EMX8_9ACTN|nr:TetR family transcriptional regulator [Parenemella sanctibonifatiensis]OYN92331.1 TetR family transcriptional regulator [Parenemella sanctibonifatiensis]
MRSTPAGSKTRAEDLTVRARIRDAAIRMVAAQGLQVPLRAIAAEAGVSAALILHHYGSRAGLITACDAAVVEVIGETKSDALMPGGGASALMIQLSQIEGYAPVVGYVLRCLQAGGSFTRQLVDALVEETESYLADAVTAGMVSPSQAPEQRARLLVEQALGGMLVAIATDGTPSIDELPGWFRRYSDRILTPALEMYTVPLLTDPSLLEAYASSQTPTSPTVPMTDHSEAPATPTPGEESPHV